MTATSATAAAAAAAASVKQQAIPRLFPRALHHWVGNDRIFRSLLPYEKYAVVRYLNSAYNAAPLFKWSLSIVPLYGIFSGYPPAEAIDINSTLALFSTGVVWFFYALLITPQNSGSRALAAVNFCLAGVHGYNAYRYTQYRRTVRATA